MEAIDVYREYSEQERRDGENEAEQIPDEMDETGKQTQMQE